jgi:hypothetical protein
LDALHVHVEPLLPAVSEADVMLPAQGVEVDHDTRAVAAPAQNGDQAPD